MSKHDPTLKEAAEEVLEHPSEILAARSPLRVWADRMGICLSTLCAIHCVLTPILLLSLPSLGLVVEFHETFHHVLLIVLPVLAVLAFIPGYRRHRDLKVFYWALPGFLFIATSGLAFEEAHRLVPTVISLAGSLLLIKAHLTNRRLCACCQTHHGHRSSRRSLPSEAKNDVKKTLA